MAVGSRAVRTLSEKTGVLLASVDRASVCLQGAELWPLGSLGGGRTTPHVEPSHLVNLMFAVCCAAPITSAPTVVPAYRALVENELQTIKRKTTPDGVLITAVQTDRRAGFLKPALRRFGPTLGQQIDGLVTILQQPTNRVLREYLRFGRFELAMTLGPVPQATLTVSQRMPYDPDETVEVLSFVTPQDALPMQEPIPAARPIHVVTVRFELLDVLIDLWDDTVAHRKRNAEVLPGTSAFQTAKSTTRSGGSEPNSSDSTSRVSSSATARSCEKEPDYEDEDPCGLSEAAD